MRTCSKCGCYLPDNWTTCPACLTSFNAESEQNDYIYEVSTCYWDDSFSIQYFKFYENALYYEQQQLKRIETVKFASITKRKIIHK